MAVRMKRARNGPVDEAASLTGEEILAEPHNGTLVVTIAHKDGSACAVLRVSFEDATQWLKKSFVFVSPPVAEYEVREVRKARTRAGRLEVKVVYTG